MDPPPAAATSCAASPREEIRHSQRTGGSTAEKNESPHTEKINPALPRISHSATFPEIAIPKASQSARQLTLQQPLWLGVAAYQFSIAVIQSSQMHVEVSILTTWKYIVEREKRSKHLDDRRSEQPTVSGTRSKISKNKFYHIVLTSDQAALRQRRGGGGGQSSVKKPTAEM